MSQCPKACVLNRRYTFHCVLQPLTIHVVNHWSLLLTRSCEEGRFLAQMCNVTFSPQDYPLPGSSCEVFPGSPVWSQRLGAFADRGALCDHFQPSELLGRFRWVLLKMKNLTQLTREIPSIHVKTLTGPFAVGWGPQLVTHYDDKQLYIHLCPAFHTLHRFMDRNGCVVLPLDSGYLWSHPCGQSDRMLHSLWHHGNLRRGIPFRMRERGRALFNLKGNCSVQLLHKYSSIIHS